MIVNQDSYNKFDYYVNMIFKSDKEQKSVITGFTVFVSVFMTISYSMTR
jgi:hypothetical protein